MKWKKEQEIKPIEQVNAMLRLKVKEWRGKSALVLSI